MTQGTDKKIQRWTVPSARLDFWTKGISFLSHELLYQHHGFHLRKKKNLWIPTDACNYILALFKVINCLQLRFPPPCYIACSKYQHKEEDWKSKPSRRITTNNVSDPTWVVYFCVGCGLQDESSQRPIKRNVTNLTSIFNPDKVKMPINT